MAGPVNRLREPDAGTADGTEGSTFYCVLLRAFFGCLGERKQEDKGEREREERPRLRWEKVVSAAGIEEAASCPAFEFRTAQTASSIRVNTAAF